MSSIERHVRVQRSARFQLLGAPGAGVRELWVACHGYGQLAATFAKPLETVVTSTRVVVVPEALNRFYLDDPNKRHGPQSPVGATWMTREDREHEIADYVEYLDAVSSLVIGECGTGDVAVVALGFSQGVATVSRWAALGRTPIARLVLWGGSLPPDLPGDTGDRLFRGATVEFVVGRKDFLVSPTVLDADRSRLEGRGIPSTLTRFEGGHALNSETLRQLAGVGQ